MKSKVWISISILLGILGSLHSQDFYFQVNGGEYVYTIPADTLVRNIHLSQRLSNEHPSLHGLDTLTFTFQPQNEDTVEYKFGPFMYSDGSEIYPTVNFLIEGIGFSSLDSMIVGAVAIDSQWVEGIRYVDLPGDSLSGFQVVLSGEDPNGLMAYIEVPYLTQSCSDWRNFQPLQVGNIWRWSIPSESSSATRLEILDVTEDAGQQTYTVARERVEGYDYTLLPPDTFHVVTFDTDLYKIYGDGEVYSVLSADFRPLPEEYQQFGIEAVVPTVDGKLLYESSSTAGTDIWTWGIGRTSGGWDGGGSLDLWGFRLGDSLWGNIDHLVSVHEENFSPETFNIFAYPNPFNPSTTIHYRIPEQADVYINIYDLLGREIWSREIPGNPAGYQSLQWNGLNASGNKAASGVYLITLTTSEIRLVQKALLIR
ncbi:MAG: T9SS type A sorting domain-containing protein [Candidatus Marinimicrobia bacterium]|nr:T9SS type A sorting domain-containing protein [Candidatus Neomarinimicrobiota bacterium]